MANVKLVRTIRDGTADLAKLQGASLQGAKLQGANLQGAKLQEADLQKADLRESILRKTNLKNTNLKKADLRGANLQEADMLGAYLQGADLQGANLQGANLRSANLQGAKLQEATLQEANLNGGTLQEANLAVADLQGANLQEANLQRANLPSANLREASLQRANLQGAKLQWADLKEADLQWADLQGADLEGAHLDFAIIDNWPDIDLPPGYEIRKRRIVPTEGNEQPDPTDENKQPDPTPTNKTRKETIATIGARLAEAPKRYAGETDDFASLFDVEIDWWKSKKPNEEDKAEEWEAHHNFLQQIRDGFNDLTAKIKRLEKQSTSKNKQDAGEQALTLKEKLRDAFTDTISDKRKNLALLSIIGGATVVISGIIGVNPNLAFSVSTAAIGGGKLVETAGKLIKKSRGKSPKSKDKPSDDEEGS